MEVVLPVPVAPVNRIRPLTSRAILVKESGKLNEPMEGILVSSLRRTEE